MDLISRQAAIDAIMKKPAWHNSDGSFYHSDDIRKALSELPSAQPERKAGKWIKKMRVTETEKYISYDPDWYCACCGAKYDSHIAKFVNFCYVCGADMRGEKNEID